MKSDDIETCLRRLNLVIIGAAKAGTTTFEYMLKEAGAINVSQRRSIFGPSAENAFVEQALGRIRAESKDSILFHVRANYMSDSDALNQISEKTNAQVVMICRDPSDRLWSHFQHDFKKGRSDTDKGFDIWLQSKRGKSAFQLSLYGHSLRQLKSIFSYDRLHILQTEDLNSLLPVNKILTSVGISEISTISENPKNVSRIPWSPAVMRAANKIIEPLPRGRIKTRLIKLRTNILTVDKRSPRTPKNIRDDLQNMFIDDILLFQKLSGLDVSDWMK